MPHRLTRSAAAILVFLLSPGLAGAQTAPPKPEIAFEAEAVAAFGLTPGETVVWFGVERRVDPDFSTEVVRHAEVGTAGADGTARLALGREVAVRSLWVAVDLETGELAVAAPDGYRIARPERPATRLSVQDGDQADHFLDERPYLMGLVVRPGAGAWVFAGGDGGDRDEDGQSDGRLSFALDGFDPLPGSPAPPAKARAEDLWLVIDPRRMEITVLAGGIAR
jgi:hypothetical protein